MSAPLKISPQKRSPAPRANADRAESKGTQDSISFITEGRETETDFAACWIAARFRLPIPLARSIAALAYMGRAFQ